MRTNSLSLRLVLGAAFSVAVALVAAALILSALFRDYVERNFQARLDTRLDSLIAVAELDDEGHPKLRRDLGEPLFEQPLSGWYWQITATDGGQPEVSRSLWDFELDIDTDLPAGRDIIADMAGPGDQKLRAVSRRITLPEAQNPFVFTVAANRAAIGAETGPFTLTLALSLGVLGVVLIAAMFVQVRFGLRPLDRIPKSLAEIRSGQADKLSGHFPAEVEPLVVEINALIDHNAAVVERARTHVGNLAHALKTPLAVLGNEADRDRSAFADLVRRQTGIMARYVDHYLARARTAARSRSLGARTAVMAVAEDLRRTLGHIHESRRLTIDLRGHDRVFRGEREDLEEMLGNLMENACKWARSRVRVVVAEAGGSLTIAVEDDGPGLDPGAREQALARGRRLDESKPGTGLGLAIVADVAELYGGSLVLTESDLGGLAAILTLPAVN